MEDKPNFQWRWQLLRDKKMVDVPVKVTILGYYLYNDRLPLMKVQAMGNGVDFTRVGGPRTFRKDFWDAAMQCLGMG
tara:strand:- start:541 stop:771 length:231 start_codon:yes stop_codon:yes gene_type:complete